MKMLAVMVASFFLSGCGATFSTDLPDLPGGVSTSGSSSDGGSGDSSGGSSGTGGSSGSTTSTPTPSPTTPTPTPTPTPSSTGIEVQSTQTVTVSSTAVTNNLVYDGTRLVLPDTGGGQPIDDTVTFDYLSTSLTLQTQSTSNYGNANIYYGYSSSTPTAGQSALFWTTSFEATSGTLSVRDDSSGSVLSNTSINFANYGCVSPGPITTCGGTYYGVCTTTGGYMRFFSFDTSGTMQSAVTTANAESSYDKLNAITCYDGAYLLLVTNYSSSNAFNGFYKYNLSFSLVATDSNTSYSFPAALEGIVGIATDGSYLYLQGRTNETDNNTNTVGKATLGGLE